MARRRIKAIVFDSDGTLFTLDGYLPRFASVMGRVLRKLKGKIITDKTELYEPFRGEQKDSDKFMKDVFKVNPKEYWKVLSHHDMEERKKILGKEINVFPDTTAIDSLKGKYKLGLLSNTPQEIIDYQLNHFGMAKHFDAKVCSVYKDEKSKPEVRGAMEVLQKLGVKPEEAIMVGDAEVDVQVGKRLGMTTVQVKRDHSHHYEKMNPDFTIRSLEELEDVIETLHMK